MLIVITPVYNEEKYIVRYIESIVQEAFDCGVNLLKTVVIFQ